MDDDTQALAVGLGAGLGGFAGLVIVVCICWQIFCGSWCEKKNLRSIPVPVKKQRQITTATTKVQNNVSTITPMESIHSYSNLKLSASNDLANKVKLARQ